MSARVFQIAKRATLVVTLFLLPRFRCAAFVGYFSPIGSVLVSPRWMKVKWQDATNKIVDSLA